MTLREILSRYINKLFSYPRAAVYLNWLNSHPTIHLPPLRKERK